MNILVCLKQILDPEVPVRDFAIDGSGLQADPNCANQMTNIFCENALETALQLKDAHGGKITVLSFGPDSVKSNRRGKIALSCGNKQILVGIRFRLPNQLWRL